MTDEKSRAVTGNPQNQNQYVANYYPPLTQTLPQPVPPPASTWNPLLNAQTVTGHVIVEGGRPVREREHCLPCCGLGMGWFLFIIGFFLGGFPWYVGALIVLCTPVDYREKPGYVACAIADPAPGKV